MRDAALGGPANVLQDVQLGVVPATLCLMVKTQSSCGRPTAVCSLSFKDTNKILKETGIKNYTLSTACLCSRLHALLPGHGRHRICQITLHLQDYRGRPVMSFLEATPLLSA